MSFFRTILYSVFITVIAASCGSTKSTVSSTPKGTAPVANEDKTIQATYAYFSGIKEKLNGNSDKAVEEFSTCLRHDPTNHAAMYELASIFNDKRKYNDALFFAKSAVELNRNNEWYKLLLADTYEKTGKFTEAAGIYHELVKQYPDRVDFYFGEAEALLYQEKYQDAIRVYDDVEQQIGISRELTLRKQSLYLKQGKVAPAAAELEKLIKSEPSNLENYSMLVEMYQVNNMPDKAMEVIKRMQAIDPENPNIFLSLAEYYRSNGQKEESFQQLKKAFASNQLNSDVKIRILTSYLPLVATSPDMLTQALDLSKQLSESHPTEANPQAVYGDFLGISKNYEAARVQYRKALEIDRKNLQAWQQLVNIEAELRDFTAMEKESDEALSLYADQSAFYLSSGIAKNQNKKYDEAASVLLSGSKLVVDNDALRLNFYSMLGDTYNSMKKYDDSDKYYEKALLIDPNNTYVLNNYAYFLSVRKDKLEKAEAMSKKVTELNAGNANYEDTYAWVLYASGKYEDAKTWLETALKNGGSENGTILEHYGDVLFKLGKTEEALSNWMKAKQSADHSELLDKKIADKKLYE